MAVALAAAFGGRTVPTASAEVKTVNVTNMKAKGNAYDEEGNLISGKDLLISLDFTADPADGGFKKGDYFEIVLPDTVAAVTTTFPLKNGDNTVGQCEANQASITCTIDDNALANLDSISGEMSFGAYVKAKDGQASNSATINVPGNPSSATLKYVDQNDEDKGTPGIKPAPDKPSEGRNDIVEMEKSVDDNAYYKTEDGKYAVQIDWGVWIPASAFKDLEEFEITDYITVNGQANGKVAYAEKDARADDGTPVMRAEQIKKTAAGEKRVATQLDFESEAITGEGGAPGIKVTVKRPAGGWMRESGDAEAEVQPMYFAYRTIYTDEGGFPENGTQFQNKVAAQDETHDAVFEYVPTGQASIKGVKRGAFELTKKVEKPEEWSADCPIIDDQEYEVEISIDVADSANTGFQFPQTKAEKGEGASQDGTTITYTEKLKNGDTVRGYDELPQGAKVSFKEKMAEVEGVTFEEPEFAPSSEITIARTEDGTAPANAQVTLTNPVKCEDQPSNPNTGEFHVKKVIESTDGKRNLDEQELADVKKELQENGGTFPVTLKFTFPEGTKMEDVEQLSKNSDDFVVAENGGVEAASVNLDLALGGYEDERGALFTKLPVGTKVEISEGSKKPKLKGYKWGTESIVVTNPDTEEVEAEGKNASFTINEGGECFHVVVQNPIEKDKSGLWWLLLLIPAIPGLFWLFNKFPGMSSTPTPGQPGTPGDKPGKPGENPEPGLPGVPEQPVKPGTPGDGRQPIQSVPSGATEKGDDVADFIG